MLTYCSDMPFGAVQLIAILGSAWAATHWKMKSPTLAALCVPPIIGISIMLGVPYKDSNRGVLLFGYYITSVYPAITPLIYSWSGQNTGGDTKRKMTTACMFIGASAGNIIGSVTCNLSLIVHNLTFCSPYLYEPSDAPHYTKGLASNLALFVFIIIVVGLGAAWIRILNRKHAAARERLGKSANVVDLSMEHKKVLASHDEAINDGLTAGGVGDKAFDDITDLNNEDFIYLY